MPLHCYNQCFYYWNNKFYYLGHIVVVLIIKIPSFLTIFSCIVWTVIVTLENWSYVTKGLFNSTFLFPYDWKYAVADFVCCFNLIVYGLTTFSRLKWEVLLTSVVVITKILLPGKLELIRLVCYFGLSTEANLP